VCPLTGLIPVYKNPAEGVTGNLTTHGVGPSNWLAGIDIDSFPGDTIGERVARAAASINATFLSPVATSVSISFYTPARGSKGVGGLGALAAQCRWMRYRRGEESHQVQSGVRSVARMRSLKRLSLIAVRVKSPRSRQRRLDPIRQQDNGRHCALAGSASQAMDAGVSVVSISAFDFAPGGCAPRPRGRGVGGGGGFEIVLGGGSGGRKPRKSGQDQPPRNTPLTPAAKTSSRISSTLA